MTYFVHAEFDLRCNWQGQPPVYRVFVDDEMFAERQWCWDQRHFLREILQMQVPAGKYTVSIVPVGNQTAEFIVSNNQIIHGPARWQKTHRIIVQP